MKRVADVREGIPEVNEVENNGTVSVMVMDGDTVRVEEGPGWAEVATAVVVLVIDVVVEEEEPDPLIVGM